MQTKKIKHNVLSVFFICQSFVGDVLILQVSFHLHMEARSHTFKPEYLRAHETITSFISSGKPSLVVKRLKYFISLKLLGIDVNATGRSLVSIKVYALENVYSDIISQFSFTGHSANTFQQRLSFDKTHLVWSNITNISYTVAVSRKDISWTKAVDICAKLGGELPSLNSLLELKAMIALILHSYQAERRLDYLEFFRAVYIGHKTEVEKVQLSLLSQAFLSNFS